jgi:hypothetical protein
MISQSHKESWIRCREKDDDLGRHGIPWVIPIVVGAFRR